MVSVSMYHETSINPCKDRAIIFFRLPLLQSIIHRHVITLPFFEGLSYLARQRLAQLSNGGSLTQPDHDDAVSFLNRDSYRRPSRFPSRVETMPDTRYRYHRPLISTSLARPPLSAGLVNHSPLSPPDKLPAWNRSCAA